jgi:MinD-like ATPase involved in chromosome partitioning or flagellar assembly
MVHGGPQEEPALGFEAFQTSSSVLQREEDQAPPYRPEAATNAAGAGPRPNPPAVLRQVASPAPAEAEPVSAQDFLRARHRAASLGPATWGWRGRVRRWSAGLVSPEMGPAERRYRQARTAVLRTFAGPRTIVVANPKGGAHKTTSVLMAGMTFGTVRGGSVLAWDNNETRGTLGVRSIPAAHHNTAKELLGNLELFRNQPSARLGDLGRFVRGQGEAHFDVLASDEDAEVTGQIRAEDFRQLHEVLERFYRLLLIDTGNNMRAENWLTAIDTSHLLVVTSTIREDTGYSGLWMLDALEKSGRGELVRNAVTVLSAPAPRVDEQLAHELERAYRSRTRAAVRVPHDPQLEAGTAVEFEQLQATTRAAWLHACAAMAEGL